MRFRLSHRSHGSALAASVHKSQNVVRPTIARELNQQRNGSRIDWQRAQSATGHPYRHVAASVTLVVTHLWFASGAKHPGRDPRQVVKLVCSFKDDVGYKALDAHVQTQLFTDLSHGRLFRQLAGLDLAAGEQIEQLLIPPSRDQRDVTVLND